MIIAGGIQEAFAKTAEGKLRAVAVVLKKQPFGKFAVGARIAPQTRAIRAAR